LRSKSLDRLLLGIIHFGWEGDRIGLALYWLGVTDLVIPVWAIYGLLA